MDPPTKTWCQKLGVLQKVGGSGPPDRPVVARLDGIISNVVMLNGRERSGEFYVTVAGLHEYFDQTD